MKKEKNQSKPEKKKSTTVGNKVGRKDNVIQLFPTDKNLADTAGLPDSCTDLTINLPPVLDAVDAFCASGDLHFEEGRYAEALKSYEKALNILPDDGDLLANAGLTHYMLGDSKKAFKLVEKAIALEPENSFAMVALANLFNFKGEPEKAIEQLEKCLEFDPYNTTVIYDLAETYYDIEETELAERLCHEIFGIDPEYAMAHFLLGNIAIDNDQMQIAAYCFKQYLQFEKSPDAKEIIVEVKAVLADLEEELSQTEKSKKKPTSKKEK